jgi:AraC family transcriptional regulator, alkane utilization regulator
MIDLHSGVDPAMLSPCPGKGGSRLAFCRAGQEPARPWLMDIVKRPVLSMIGTPPSFAGTPEAARGDHDVLAEMLRAVRLTGSVFLNACFTAPFGVVSPKRYDERTPMARLRHISVFHLIAAGACTIELATGERRTVSAGDILLVPFADAHKFWNGEFDEMAHASDLVRPSPVKGMWSVNHGGGGQETRMVCGFIESSEFLFTPVFRTLPSLLIDRTGDDKISALLASTVREY